jgi:hypothetical protein
MSDLFVGHSSVTPYKSYVDNISSPFMKTFCEEIQSKQDIVRIFTKVTYKVSNMKIGHKYQAMKLIKMPLGVFVIIFEFDTEVEKSNIAENSFSTNCQICLVH